MRTSQTTTITATLRGVSDLKQRGHLQRLLENRDRLAAAAAVFEAHSLGDPAEIRRVQYLCEAEIALDYPQAHRRLAAGWVERDAELAHDGMRRRSPNCPICDPRNPGLADVRRMAA